MTLKQVLKAMLFGFCLSTVLEVISVFVVPIICGIDPIEFICECGKSLLYPFLNITVVAMIVCIPFAAHHRKTKRREELEDVMKEYFRKQNEQNEKQN